VRIIVMHRYTLLGDETVIQVANSSAPDVVLDQASWSVPSFPSFSSATATAPQPPPLKAKATTTHGDGDWYSNTTGGHHSSIAVLRNGSLLSCSRGHPINGTMPFSRSDDGGRTWLVHGSQFPAIEGGQREVMRWLPLGGGGSGSSSSSRRRSRFDRDAAHGTRRDNGGQDDEDGNEPDAAALVMCSFANEGSGFRVPCEDSAGAEATMPVAGLYVHATVPCCAVHCARVMVNVSKCLCGVCTCVVCGLVPGQSHPVDPSSVALLIIFLGAVGRRYCAMSLDEGTTWPFQRVITDDLTGSGHVVAGFDGTPFVMAFNSSEPDGYMDATPALGGSGVLHLITSRNHYEFNASALLTQRAACQPTSR
jgi:hypothetical protein